MTASAPPAMVLDEMVDGRGGVRPHWRPLLGVLAGLGPEELVQRRLRLERAFEEEGVSGAPSWRCDPVPLPLEEGEFRSLVAGLVQRARLLEALLGDLYGPQAMLAEGLLPPALVFANPGFLRPLRPACQPGWLLQSYAADLVRAPDGTWRVAADRTAGASGAGYARENRRLMARVLPELFRASPPRQLRPFFERWQDALLRLAPPLEGRPPVLALLTPGAAGPHWLEHMVLARELSCALVEGRDLAVRDGALWLKTLRGLRPIDVLLRRADGRMLDPLELMAESTLGVAGLLGVMRDGRVRVLNDPGTGLVEAPALAAFLPALCRRLLGEDLALPGLPTLWLGDEGARSQVGQEPDRWRLRPAMDGMVPAAPSDATDPGLRARQDEAVRARPWDWAATAALDPSVAPFLGEQGLDPAPVVLRLFLVRDVDGWHAMEGGVAWACRDLGAAGPLPAGGPFKDVWVVSQETGNLRGPDPLPQPRLQVRRTAGDLPSRVADDLFWFGRYIERLEQGARLSRALLGRLGRGSPLPRDAAERQMLSEALQAAEVAEPVGPPLAVLQHTFAEGTLQRDLRHAGRLLDGLRDRLTGEMHGAVAEALRVARAPALPGVDGMVQAMDRILRLSTTVAGLAGENMVRGGGRLFLDLGRRVERATATAAWLSSLLDDGAGRLDAGLRLALELCDSVITYRARYGAVLQAGPVLDLVVADDGNPRALAFQFTQARAMLAELEDGGSALAQQAERLRENAACLVAGVIAAEDPAGAASACAPGLAALADGAGALSEGMTRRYFALLPGLRVLGMGMPDGETADAGLLGAA